MAEYCGRELLSRVALMLRERILYSADYLAGVDEVHDKVRDEVEARNVQTAGHDEVERIRILRCHDRGRAVMSITVMFVDLT